MLTPLNPWGLLKEDPDYLAVAKQIKRIELYRQAAAQLNVAVPADAMRSSRLMDVVVWDGRDPERYASGFKRMLDEKNGAPSLCNSLCNSQHFSYGCR